MKLFSSLSRKLVRDGAHIVDPRQAKSPWLLILTLTSLLTSVLGCWLGGRVSPAAAPATPVAATPGSASTTVALERMGVLVGRLQSLEADTQALQRMLEQNRQLRDQVSAVDPSLLVEPSTRGAQGGAWLPARSCNAGAASQGLPLRMLGASEQVALCLRQQLDLLLNRVASRNAALMAIPSLRPVEQARLGSLFGNRVDPFTGHLAFHSGVDFAAPTGTQVHAAAGGRVQVTGALGGYGNRVEVAHGNGLVTRYAHLSRIFVKEGQVVTPGQLLGAVGSTGRSTGPHLHFEVLRDGQFLDPQRFLALGRLEPERDGQARD
ncbi:M23 family metallopeptidase [Pseudomonas sp. PLB05]|uniref:M23 family metallopeptidase n=1 Tax=Pseudomonas sp. PLB05 TaxID=2899078 RepID=UPI001E3107A8|nr:M23 family metallopeptidase [Pseudomonas sp. PLB05]MCD4864090.1 M23 family metallopeptidase [Pseudomonas sp. PLB05]